MSAYAMPQHEQTARLLHLERDLSETWSTSSRAIDRTGMGEASILDALVDRLADRLATALVARLSREPFGQHDDWFDSRQAAEYLGLHRDTLRRLAAARAIPAEQDGRGCKLFFRRAALDEWRRSGGRIRHLAAVTDVA